MKKPIILAILLFASTVWAEEGLLVGSSNPKEQQTVIQNAHILRLEKELNEIRENRKVKVPVVQPVAAGSKEYDELYKKDVKEVTPRWCVHDPECSRNPEKFGVSKKELQAAKKAWDKACPKCYWEFESVYPDKKIDATWEVITILPPMATDIIQCPKVWLKRKVCK